MKGPVPPTVPSHACGWLYGVCPCHALRPIKRPKFEATLVIYEELSPATGINRTRLNLQLYSPCFAFAGTLSEIMCITPERGISALFVKSPSCRFLKESCFVVFHKKKKPAFKGDRCWGPIFSQTLSIANVRSILRLSMTVTEGSYSNYGVKICFEALIYCTIRVVHKLFLSIF